VLVEFKDFTYNITDTKHSKKSERNKYWVPSELYIWYISEYYRACNGHTDIEVEWVKEFVFHCYLCIYRVLIGY
jgi:hypothetical protein